MCCRCFGALVQCLYGYPDRSLALCRETVDLAQGLAHPLTTALAYWACAYVHILRGEPAAAKHWAEREIAVCEDYLLPLLLSQGIFQHGWALGELGHFDEGIARMREGIAAIGVTGAEIGLPYYVALLGEALGKAGKPEAGLDEVEAALASARERGERFQVSEMLCIQGKLLTKLSKSRVGEAEALFRKAITAADKQGAKLPKLRATTSLARLLAGKGEPAKACALLQPALDAITEGRDLSHFRTAAAQLEQWKNH